MVHLKLVEPGERTPKYDKPDDGDKYQAKKVTVVPAGRLFILRAKLPDEC